MTQRKPKLTPKQKKLIALLPKVEAGEMTMKAAMIKAGYSEKTADQQQQVLGGLRTNTKMQEALDKVGVTEEKIATRIKRGMDTFGNTAFNYTKLAAELRDAFPAKKQINADVSIEDLIKTQEGSTPQA